MFCGSRQSNVQVENIPFKLLGASEFVCGIGVKSRVTNVSWLKRDGDKHDRLAKYHQRKLGIRKPSHPPYLEISESLRHMLDHVVMTFIYAEMLSKSE
ncbi:hypothetical protein F5141DRAFT_1146230 [Pisolithus sp. B1]|nr:hypothetical protein F5141DRAFT_1146230 [Pisolithus sp. B1]